MRLIALTLLGLACVTMTPLHAQALQDDRSELALALERNDREGRPLVIELATATLVHGDPNAALWLRSDINALLARGLLRLRTAQPDEDPEIQRLRERYAIVERPTLLVLTGSGEVHARWSGKIDGDALARSLAELARSMRPLPVAEVQQRAALLKRGQAALERNLPSQAIAELQRLTARRPPHYGAVRDARAWLDRIARNAAAELTASRLADAPAWSKALTTVKARYKGLATLDQVLSTAEHDRALGLLRQAANEELTAGRLEAARAVLERLSAAGDHPDAVWARTQLESLTAEPGE
jgi:hypothetical protein